MRGNTEDNVEMQKRLKRVLDVDSAEPIHQEDYVN